ncbi:MAG: class I SAM-dependent methyltransferase [Verrucomicrobiota bacterium]
MDANETLAQDRQLHESYSRRGINLHRVDAIRRHAGRSVLDVGCGNGAYVLELRDEFEIAGVDHQSYESWDEAPDSFSVVDANRLPQKDEAIDTVTAFEVLEHLSDPKASLLEWKRVCRKNLIVTVPNCEQSPGLKSSLLVHSHYTDRTHVNFFTRETLRDLVEDCGFEIRELELINAISPWPFLIEAIQFEGLAGKLARRYCAKHINRHPITLMLVAEKH